MSGYLRSLKKTGEPLIDAITDVLSDCGDSYHHTRDWSEPLGYADERSCLDLIDEATSKSAADLAALRDLAGKARELVKWVAEWDEDCDGSHKDPSCMPCRARAWLARASAAGLGENEHD